MDKPSDKCTCGPDYFDMWCPRHGLFDPSEKWKSQYLEFRKDGWPYCPICEEDELWSAAIPATAETIVSCLRCGWTPRIKTAK
jgi:hypothetical protein